MITSNVADRAGDCDDDGAVDGEHAGAIMRRVTLNAT
jgi:hypothetical protein